VAATLRGTLVDLVLPVACAGCGAPGAGLCARCRDGLAGLRPFVAVPEPRPAGFPECVALGDYDAELRGMLLAYKERGRHRLARVLGAQLGRVVAGALVTAGVPGRTPVVVVAVPSTAAAARERHGDHMTRLARQAAKRLTAAGWPAATARPLAARPKADDSTHLGAAARAGAAAGAFRPRPAALHRVRRAVAAGACVVVVDDIVTTGATLAAASHMLNANGVSVRAAATLAATRRRRPPAAISG
jgi:predicted amidophosphoribosyltransferase